MARSSASIRSCPSCLAPLVEIQLGADLRLRSCSSCDSRWWLRGDQPTDLDGVLSVVGSDDRSRKLARAGS